MKYNMAGFCYKDKTLKQKQRLIKIYETNGTLIPWEK